MVGKATTLNECSGKKLQRETNSEALLIS